MRKIRFSKRKAKRDAIAAWEWLAENAPNCKSDLPDSIYRRIKDDEARCPMCTIFARSEKHRCKKCPLMRAGMACNITGSPFNAWSIAIMNYGTSYAEKEARDAAQKILDAVRAWEV